MKADIMVQKWGLGWGLRTHILMLKLRTTLFWAPTLPGPILQTLAVLKRVAELWASHLFSWPFWKDGLWISALGGERINSLPHSSCPSGGVCWLEQLRTHVAFQPSISPQCQKVGGERGWGGMDHYQRRVVGLWSTCSPQDTCLPFVSKPGGIWALSLQAAEPWGWGPPGMLVATAPARAGEGPGRWSFPAPTSAMSVTVSDPMENLQMSFMGCCKKGSICESDYQESRLRCRMAGVRDPNHCLRGQVMVKLVKQWHQWVTSDQMSHSS